MANQVARALRKRQTSAEIMLWRELRTLRPLGYHFRRQAPLEGCIVDFACLAHLLVVEVDGATHGSDAQLAADAARDARLRWAGYDVLRFTNTAVRDERVGVMDTILAKLGAHPLVE